MTVQGLYMHSKIKHLALGLFTALLLAFLSAGSPEAQEAGAGEKLADHTITLTKVVEVYEFEGLKVSLDQYRVGRGDTLLKILKSRGFLSSAADEARLLRLVGNLNPELGDPNMIRPGQVLNLPAELDDAAEGEETPAGSARPVEPATVTETVKVYERPQPNQQSARVVVMRHRPGQGTVEMAEGPGETVAEPAETAGSPLDFPSGNHGPLALEPDSGVVYRTVKIRRGDTLERLLRREGMDSGLIYAHLLKVTLQLNPEVKNQDLIFAGAELRIPAAGDYLAEMTGADPVAVKEAALARSRGRGPEQDGDRAGALRLPSAAVETAKNTLGLIFTRLGARMDTRGRLVLPLGEGSLEFNTAEFPLVELPGERRVVLDLERKLPRRTLRGLRGMPSCQVFRPTGGGRLEKSLGQLWPLCGFYRVYDKNHSYEGGTDIKLTMAADWMIWPTEAAWKNGQPLVLNLAAAPDRKTDPAWNSFLASHGVEVMDLFGGAVLPAGAPGPPPPLQLTRLGENNPSLFAAELVKLLGAEPKVGVQLDGLSPAEGRESNLTAPVLWADQSRQVVLDFGELDPEAVQTLREADYRVVVSQSEPDKVIGAVLEGFGLAPKEALVLKAPPGGPAMSLSIKGRLVSRGARNIFFTALDMPEGISRLLPADLEVVRY